MSESPFLSSLNERQKEAATATHGPVIVLAGAGSGKTKTLITRIAHLIQLGIDPSKILAVTFTNKAAAEMKHRVEQLLGPRSRGGWAQPWMGFSPYMPEVSTFHSFCVKLLRTESERTGFTRPFVIYDDSDQLSLLKKILEEFDIEAKSSNARRFKGAIDQAKCAALGPGDIKPEEYYGPFGAQLVKVYARYQELLRSAQAYDFGDLIVEAYRLLKANPDLLEKYQERFQFLMVDEYQDTNRAQYLLITLLAGKYKNLCVVGDEDQSIYKWRGADIRNILDFRKEYPDALLVKLEQNYRSTKTIIEAASRVIKNNESRYDKTLWTDNEQGEKIRWATLPEERAEGEFVAREIQKFLSRNQGLSCRDAAVFYRSHVQSRALEEAFRKAKLPYRIVGGVGFYERKEIKDVLAYLRVLVNPDDTLSLLRIINTPARGIGKSTIEKLEDYARAHKLALFPALKKMLMEGAEGIPPSAKKKLVDFVRLIDSFVDLARREFVSEVYHHILDATGYVAELKAEDSEESKARIENLEEFDTVIQFFEEDAKKRGLEPQAGMLQAFLNQITLESSLLENNESDAGSVSLMTLHSSKGLEFPLVFIVGMEEGIFPSQRSMDEAEWEGDEVEEERRLCYVGITRAKRQLILSSASIRRIYGQVQVANPSRFLSEIPQGLLDAEIHRGENPLATAFSMRAQYASRSADFSKATSGASSYGDSRRYDYSESDAPSYQVKKAAVEGGSEIRVGQKVRHASYGNGIIKSLEGTESDRKLTIEFTGRVVKKFALKHAQLEFLS